MLFSQYSPKIIDTKRKAAETSATFDVNSLKINEKLKFSNRQTCEVEKKKLHSRIVIQILVKRLNLSSFKFTFGDMVISSQFNLKEEQLAKEIQKLPCLSDKGNMG